MGHKHTADRLQQAGTSDERLWRFYQSKSDGIGGLKKPHCCFEYSQSWLLLQATRREQLHNAARLYMQLLYMHAAVHDGRAALVYAEHTAATSVKAMQQG